MNIHNDKILIIDFGSQYTQLIARTVRELGVYSVVFPYSAEKEIIKNSNPKGVILSGGPETVILKDSPRIPQIIFELGCPVLGICYGMQAMVNQLGGKVERGVHKEFGEAIVESISDSKLFKDSKLSVWMSHGDLVVSLPESFKIIAKTDSIPVAAIENVEKKYYGVQFHPEVTHTEKGKEILSNFVHDICSCESSWNPKEIIADRIVSLKEKIGDDGVVLGLSGGVDSAVVAALLNKAIGKKLTCILVDTGLLRLNEIEQIKNLFSKHMGIKLIVVDAKEKFFEALKGVSDPEEKRKIIGGLFIDIFSDESKKLTNVKWLAQGTIYPDVIESAGSSSSSSVIKSHHNVAGLPDKLPFGLIEPLRELFKDEVRQVGLEIGLPKEMVYRHPFPGPGLAVRILGEVKVEYVEILQQADAIFIEELFKNNLYYKISQAFAVFLPVKSVAVKGDDRRYEYVISLRAVETADFMTADWVHIPYEVLAGISRRIINEVSNVSRVTYDISSKPPATIEWE